MKKTSLLKLTSLFLLSSIFLLPAALAQTKLIPETETFKAVIKAPEKVEIDKTIIMDGSSSTVSDPEEEVTYNWDFGDGNQKQGREVVHIYKNPGLYNIKLTIESQKETSTTIQEVFAARKSIVLIADDSIETNKNTNRSEGLINTGVQNGVAINLIQDSESTSEFISEEVLSKKLINETEELRKVEQIIIWTQGNTGTNALSRVQQQLSDQEKIDFSNKTILIIKSDTKEVSNIQRIYQNLNPKHIIIGKEASIYPFIESQNSDHALQLLEIGGYDYTVTDQTTGQLKIFNFMSYFVNFLIDKGVPDNTIVLLLLVPVIATVIAFMKQVIGISTFGVYTPTILTLTFWMLGFKFGVLTFAILLTTGAITRLLLKKIRILYIPKMAIVLTIVALTVFAILTITVALNLFDAKFISLTIFPLLIMSTLTEKFVSIQNEKGSYMAILIMAKTILISAIALFIIGGEIDLYLFHFKWEYIRNLVLSYPETILTLIVFNIMLGKWTGLRLLEYVRFREVFRHIEE